MGTIKWVFAISGANTVKNKPKPIVNRPLGYLKMRKLQFATNMTTLNQPIFIHSLFRTGSTYLFNVFRRSEQGYWCYLEPVNEQLGCLHENPDELLEVTGDKVAGLRHPKLGESYFWEFFQIKGSLTGLFCKSFSYDDFFIGTSSGLPEEQMRFFDALIANAKGCPVLQLCRSFGRLGALKRLFGGVHIHLWREPRNLWWSFKINDYFDAAVLLIYNARQLPPVLQEVKRDCEISGVHYDNVCMEFDHARMHLLSPRENYFSLYALWLYAFIESEKYADVTINIDRLTGSEPYRTATLQHLAELGVDGLDFSDCSVPQTIFSEQEIEFFSEIESRVVELFLREGYDKGELDNILENQAKAARTKPVNTKEFVRDLARTRAVGLRFMDQLAQFLPDMRSVQEELVIEKHYREQAESRTAEAETRAVNAESRTAEAETRAVNAEAQIADVLNSRSWRVTAPLRGLGRLLRAWQAIMKTFIKRLLLHIAVYIHTKPVCRSLLVRLLGIMPSLDRWLRRVVNSSATTVDAAARTVSSTRSPLEVSAHVAHLTPNARCIYYDFKAVIAEQQNRKDDN